MAGRAVDAIGDFIANAPLYQRLDLTSYRDRNGLTGGELYEASPILRYCSHERCRAERPYKRMHHMIGFGKQAGVRLKPENVLTVVYGCTHCGSLFWCAVQATKGLDLSAPDNRWIRKIGQMPPYDISIPADLEDALGEDAVLHRGVRRSA